MSIWYPYFDPLFLCITYWGWAEGINNHEKSHMGTSPNSFDFQQFSLFMYKILDSDIAIVEKGRKLLNGKELTKL